MNKRTDPWGFGLTEDECRQLVFNYPNLQSVSLAYGTADKVASALRPIVAGWDKKSKEDLVSNEDIVTVPVEMTRERVQEFAHLRYQTELGDACRRWLADNPEPEPEPERHTYRLYRERTDGPVLKVGHAVPAEALRPGDRVAGRVVDEAGWSATNGTDVSWANEPEHDYYPPGTLVLLDAEGER